MFIHIRAPGKMGIDTPHAIVQPIQLQLHSMLYDEVTKQHATGTCSSVHIDYGKERLSAKANVSTRAELSAKGNLLC
jgi:hypothetical protein